MNVKGALDRLGIKVERVTRGQHALSLSPLSDPEQMVTAPWRQLLEDFYWQFVDKVAQGRQKTRAEIHAVAQGRVWTGRDAVAKGLVDELGGLQRALEVARQLAHVAPEDTLEIVELPSAPKVLMPSRRPWRHTYGRAGPARGRPRHGHARTAGDAHADGPPPDRSAREARGGDARDRAPAMTREPPLPQHHGGSPIATKPQLARRASMHPPRRVLARGDLPEHPGHEREQLIERRKTSSVSGHHVLNPSVDASRSICVSISHCTTNA